MTDENEEVLKTIYTQVINKPQKVYDIYLYHSIDNPLPLIPYVEVFRAAKKGDIIKLHINSEESSYKGFITLFNHIMLTEGFVTAYVHKASSYVSLLALACHDFLLFPAGGLELSISKMLKETGFTNGGSLDKQVLFKIIKDICGKVMSKQEVTELLNGKVFFFDSEQIEERLKKRAKKRKD